jgi:hypothetical protein
MDISIRNEETKSPGGGRLMLLLLLLFEMLTKVALKRVFPNEGSVTVAASEPNVIKLSGLVI